MNRVKLRGWLVPVLMALAMPASANCHDPFALFGLWKDGGGPLTVRFSPDETNPYVGRMHNVVEPSLRDVGYYDGYPIILMEELEVASGLQVRLFKGDFAKRNRQGNLPPTPLRVKLVKDPQAFINVLFLYFNDGTGWKARHTLFCIDPR